jgi:hypothetical protein
MTIGHEERDARSAAGIHEEVAAYGTVGIDTDPDSDSDPEAGSRASGRPNKPLEPTRLNWRGHRATSCAGGSTPRR